MHAPFFTVLPFTVVAAVSQISGPIPFPQSFYEGYAARPTLTPVADLALARKVVWTSGDNLLRSEDFVLMEGSDAEKTRQKFEVRALSAKDLPSSLT